MASTSFGKSPIYSVSFYIKGLLDRGLRRGACFFFRIVLKKTAYAADNKVWGMDAPPSAKA
jgi:hypothetical protein